MSKYEWERGTFVIPSKEWAAFKARIRDEMNKAQERRFRVAETIHAHLAAESKGKRNFDLRAAACKFIEPRIRRNFFSSAEWLEADAAAAINGILRWKNGRERLVRPTKKAFPQYGNTATEFRDDEASLVLDNGRRTATWSVPENNHACDNARNTELWRALYSALTQVKWTRGSGGMIVGNDEYNRDSFSVGGGGNYVKETFGPEPSAREKTRDRRVALAYGMGGPGFR